VLEQSAAAWLVSASVFTSPLPASGSQPLPGQLAPAARRRAD